MILLRIAHCETINSFGGGGGSFSLPPLDRTLCIMSFCLFFSLQVSNSVRCMVRQDQGMGTQGDRTTGVVEISHTHNSVLSTDRWFVVRKVLDKASQV